MNLTHHHPGSIAAAVSLAARLGDGAHFIAGGTDLVIQMHRRQVAPDHVIDLRGLDELRRIDELADRFSVGALVTHKEIERHPTFRTSLHALVEAARVVGGHQVRNVGTVGGNIANASPAADVVAPLLALDAEVTLAGPAGERRVALERFLVGPRRTLREPGELLTRIDFDRLPPRSGTAFIKAGRRQAMEISVVCVAARVTLEAGRVAGAAIALGAVAPTTIRARAAESHLVGKEPSDSLFRAAGGLAAEAVSPITDVRASAEYRRLLVAALVPRALRTCLERIRETRA